MIIQDYIDEVLKKKKLTRRKLALMCNIPVQTLYSMFYSKNPIPIDKLQLICDALDVVPNMKEIDGYTEGERVQFLLNSYIQLKHDELSKMDEDINKILYPTMAEEFIHDIAEDLEVLNDSGIEEAKKRIKELTFIPKYRLPEGETWNIFERD